MTEEYERPAPVIIKFKSSSQPKGQDGFELAVSSDATEADVDRTMLLAARAREQAQAVLAGEYTGLDDEVDANVPQELKDALSRVTPEASQETPVPVRVRSDGLRDEPAFSHNPPTPSPACDHTEELENLADLREREARVDGAEVGYVGYV